MTFDKLEPNLKNVWLESRDSYIWTSRTHYRHLPSLEVNGKLPEKIISADEILEGFNDSTSLR